MKRSFDTFSLILYTNSRLKIKESSNFEDVFVFAFYYPILLRGIRCGLLMDYMIVLKKRSTMNTWSQIPCIICSSNLYRCSELSFNHLKKSFGQWQRITLMRKKMNPSMSVVVIYNSNEVFETIMCYVFIWSPNIHMYQVKRWFRKRRTNGNDN